MQRIKPLKVSEISGHSSADSADTAQPWAVIDEGGQGEDMLG